MLVSAHGIAKASLELGEDKFMGWALSLFFTLFSILQQLTGWERRRRDDRRKIRKHQHLMTDKPTEWRTSRLTSICTDIEGQYPTKGISSLSTVHCPRFSRCSNSREGEGGYGRGTERHADRLTEWQIQTRKEKLEKRHGVGNRQTSGQETIDYMPMIRNSNENVAELTV